ncbi:trihelix transcription factor GT-3b-like [Centruroides sculpturatus]|uniref:trihelix transcription factor GT-3b-like n=1 Tax=Centruroides sculpturatus TaxID=218467 RepID=UPI000C6D55C9|nr:trihelix transcription factor GT-3b-like [Centruroides sculpturatus]
MREQIGLPEDVDINSIRLASKSHEEGESGDFSWTDSSTRLLITTRLNMDDEFRKPIRKTKLWDSISKKMENHGYTISPSDCDKKWRNLKTTYKRNRDKAKQHTGESAITWPYFKLLDQELGSRVDINPPEESIISSEPCVEQIPSPSELSSSSSGLPAHSECDVAAVHLPSINSFRNHTNLKRKRKENPPEWFQAWASKQEQEKKEDREREDQRWQEFKEIEEKRLKQEKECEEKRVNMMSSLLNVLQKIAEK